MPFLRYFFISVAMLGLLVVGWAGFRGEKTTKRPLMIFPDMDDQPKIGEQDTSAFFSDGKGGRKPISGTVPRGIESPGSAHAPEFTAGTGYYHTGRMGDVWGDGFPAEVTVNDALIRQGADRYNIYCSICHGYAGDGKGVTGNTAYGIPGIANFHSPPFYLANDAGYRSDGNLFNTITYGKGLMGPYGAMIPVSDRWAIIAYIRTLQQAKLAATTPAAK